MSGRQKCVCAGWWGRRNRPIDIGMSRPESLLLGNADILLYTGAQENKTGRGAVMQEIRPFSKLLVANRGEIAIRVLRAATELGIHTVAIYSKEDSLALHRYKADEAYLIGEGKGPVEAYLDIEGIIALAKRLEVDAIHPGYGFLAENARFAARCEEEGIAFIGPRPQHLEAFGDKVTARQMAVDAGLPVIPGTPEPVRQLQDALRFAREHGFPLIVKAAAGGGGRGMRVVRHKEDLEEALSLARSEAEKSFGDGTVYLEKFLEHPKHIEVQILGDRHGNLVHLFERDCSIQRRHQKVVEIAPALTLTEPQRQAICDAALRLMRRAGYVGAGTVEFLVAPDGSFYFIEVNPRIQVEHTITELITGVDLVQAQILIAQGYRLDDPAIGIRSQESIHRRGYAIQCRVTTEDPDNHFVPDTGKILAYRSAAGFGIRLDSGNGYAGAVIQPYYDSLLVKISAWALTFESAAHKMLRSLREFRIRGVKTNIPFLENVVQHPDFLAGRCDTSFIDGHPELFRTAKKRDRGTKLLQFIGRTTVNGHPGIKKSEKKPRFRQALVPDFPDVAPSEAKGILDREGPEALARWVMEQKPLLVTDTTFRDAHQSLLATRVRTQDLLRVAQATAKGLPQLFSWEMWGGATFDVAMRFLKECPWERLARMREAAPNVLFQMLFRGANAVGYTNYPDNVITAFVREAARSGIDVFRIFDSLNWLPGMELAIDAVRREGKVAEAALCYTGDILDPKRDKYTLKYYVNLAKNLERAGANILGIKDMAGLLKPYAAEVLIRALKEEIGIPIHLHTHDTSGNGVAMLLKAAEAGVDIVDTAINSVSGLTSQPSMGAVVAALRFQERDTGIDLGAVDRLSHYWEVVRCYYEPFESGLRAPSTDVYYHEMPGGQFTNLRQQAEAVGLGTRWDEVVRAYRAVNDMFGDIVKVTPSSKVVGDLALFMVQNGWSPEDVITRGETVDFPQSVVEFFRGYIGQPPGGFPPELQKVVLKGKEPITCRPGELLEPFDFAAARRHLEEKFGRAFSDRDLLSYALYPQVFEEFVRHREEFGDVSVLNTPTFFYGLRLGEEITVDIEPGKTLMVQLTSVGELRPDGTRVVYFELNGTPREVTVRDESAQVLVQERRKANPAMPGEIGATMPGKVSKIMVEPGDEVRRGELLMVTEAMKMETALQAPFDGVVREVLVKELDSVEAGDLLLVMEKVAGR
ncbi:pyruvate carboxylase [Kyrpidia spormannii]|uniref:Pyruvate carboxylase n=2 Tax=Kyrpidia spormannii TaxID=2055160 RepID=A0A6F9E867_9BACL|nr:pyruvate carboxylase [Kyrpidia spormannii]